MKNNRLAKKLVIILFLVSIILPAAQMKFKIWNNDILEEKRPKAPLPALTLQSVMNGTYTEEFEKFFNDSFGFRDRLIKLNSKVDMSVFRTSSSTKVILGKEDYLFFNQTIDDYNKKPTINDEAATEIAVKLARLESDLKERGITFVFLIGPNKNTVYPEYMPFVRKFETGESNYDKLLAELKKYNVNHIDMLPIFYDIKSQHQLYFKRDTHWNHAGSVLVVAEVIKNLEDKMNVAISKPRITGYRGRLPEEDGGYDLNIMLGIDKHNKTDQHMPIIEYGNIDRKLPPTLWYGDSFSEFPVQHYRNYTVDLTFLHYDQQKIDESLAARSQGKSIVVLEVVERSIPKLLTILDKPAFK